MTHLDLAFLGTLQTTFDHQVIEHFESYKARGLLVFLTVEHHRPHSRDALAELLWPGRSMEASRGNFRRALANLRSVLGDQTAHPPYLHITRETVQFNLASDTTVDVVRFRELVKTPETEPAWVDQVAQAVALYRGPFLEGFHADECQEFEQWITAVRSELERLAADALYQLAHHYHVQADVERALPLYRRSLLLNPYDEVAQRGLMIALAASGQRSVALANYTAYRRELHEELGAEPEAQTAELFRAIQQGRFTTGEDARLLSEIGLAAATVPARVTPADHRFVGRDKELAALHACARQVAQGRGAAVFVLGEAGSGKTSLLYEFARQLGRSNLPWLVARGNCTALLGIGDLYQPFVDGLRMLVNSDTGPPDAHSLMHDSPAEGLSHPTEAVRLIWEQAPDWARLAMAGAVTDSNAQPAGRLAPLLTPPAPTTTARGDRSDQAPQAPRAALFDQLARFLERLAWRRPLLLVLDNLHWADAGTLALLIHLAQPVAHGRVLIAGAYRPGALALTQAEHGHPLNTTIQTLRHQFGAALIDLDQADGRCFVDAILDREPNRLDEPFRQALYRQTEGHALFTVELLHTLRATGWLSQDQEGRWVASGVLDWDAFPPRVDALIRERVDRLSPADRTLLNAACIQGDEFGAEIVAAVLGVDTQAVVDRLSGELATAYRLVLPGGVQVSAVTPVAHYRFRHHLFQTYLYGALDEVQRARLHRDVGLELERLVAQQAAAAGVALQELAWHFERAGERGRALDYLRAAGQRALEWHAYTEAASYLTKALALAAPEDHALRFELLAAREQAHRLLRDHQTQAQDVGELERLAELSQDPHQRLVAALRRATLAEETTHYVEAITAANAALALAAANHDELAELEGHRIAGRAHWWRGELDLARRHYVYALRKARALPIPEAIGDCLLHLGVACWSMDDLAGAEAAFDEALVNATALDAPFLRAAAKMGLGMVAGTRGDTTQSAGMLDDALTTVQQLGHPWLEGQVQLNQLALCRLSASYSRFFAIYDQLEQHCQAIDDRWTTAAAQVEAAALFVQLGAWARAKTVIEEAVVTTEALGALLLKARLLLLEARLYLNAGESLYEAAADQALPIAAKLGVASIVAESRLLAGLVRQRQGQLAAAADSLHKARAAAQGDAAQRLLPEILGAQAHLALETGDAGLALAYVEELLAGSPTPLITQAVDPSSLYFVCFSVLEAMGDPWAEQMLVRGCRLLREHAALIPEAELRRSYCEHFPRHRELLALCSRFDESFP